MRKGAEMDDVLLQQDHTRPHTSAAKWCHCIIGVYSVTTFSLQPAYFS